MKGYSILRAALAFTLGLTLALAASVETRAQQTGAGGGSGLPAGGTASNMLIGTPAWTTVFPNGMTGTTQASGDAALNVTTDQFVALAIAAVNPATAVNEATAAAVLSNTPTYSNGAAGVGATLTSATNTALTVDSVSVALNDRVLVKDQASTFQNGVYTETQVGTGSVPWILTRATDYNTPANVNYTGTVSVISGTVNANTDWLLVSTISAIGSPNAITYVAQSGGPSTGGGNSVKCKTPLTTGRVMVGQGGANCGVLASSGANGQVLLSQGAGNNPAFANIAGAPQGRLTLTTGTPVMTADVAAGTTIYYDCYAGSAVLYFNGTGDASDNIAACEVSSTINSTQEHIGDLFDVFYNHATLTICVATNGAGLGWAGDTGGSTTARGTGYSQLHNTRGYWTNQNSIAHCYNGSTDQGSVGADLLTYLGTFYTQVAGQIAQQFQPAAIANGANSCMCLWNAYNRIVTQSVESDTGGGSTFWSYSSATWRAADGSSSNVINYVDGLGQSAADATYTDTAMNVIASTSSGQIGINSDSTSATPTLSNTPLFYSAAASIQASAITSTARVAPKIGFHYVSAMESAANATAIRLYGTANGMLLSLKLAN